MIRIAFVALELPDGRIVVQRRGKEAPVSPGLLGFFGGHIEKGEEPLQAATRELKEETSLNFKDLEFIATYTIDKDTLNRLRRRSSLAKDEYQYNLFKLKIDKPNFQVYEGVGAEVYSLQELRKREDATVSTDYAVNNLLGDK
jgi:8-oxo-dGTP pyrophosphatase MutT (NUDIX family)